MKRIALLFPIIAGILFGTVGIFVRGLTGAGFSNLSIVWVRNCGATLMLFPVILIMDRSLLKIKKSGIPWIVLCGIVGMMGTNICFNISSTTLSLALAAVLLSISPVYTVLISHFAFKEEIYARKIICMILSIIGCFLVSGVIGSVVSWSIEGIIAGIISGITYGLYSIFTKQATLNGMQGLTLTFYCVLLLALVTAPMADFPVIAGYITEAPLQHLIFLLLHSLCIAVLPYLLITLSLRHLSPGKVTILASSEPMAAMVFGVLFFDEIPTVWMIAGLCLTIIALIYLCKKKRTKPATE